MITEREIQQAIIAALTASNANPKTPDDIPADQAQVPDTYTEVWVAEVPGERERLGSGVGFRQFRILTRAVGRTYYSNAQTMRARANAALEDAVLAVAGAETSPIIREVADDPIEKDGTEWWSGSSTWRLFV